MSNNPTVNSMRTPVFLMLERINRTPFGCRMTISKSEKKCPQHSYRSYCGLSGAWNQVRGVTVLYLQMDFFVEQLWPMILSIVVHLSYISGNFSGPLKFVEIIVPGYHQFYLETPIGIL